MNLFDDEKRGAHPDPAKARPNPTTTRHGDDLTQPDPTQYRPDRQICRSGRCWVGSGWVRSSPFRVVVGLGRASVGRVGVGSDRVGSGRLRVELWSGVSVSGRIGLGLRWDVLLAMGW